MSNTWFYALSTALLLSTQYACRTTGEQAPDVTPVEEASLETPKEQGSIQTQAVAKGESVDFGPIYFEFDSATLGPRAREQLSEIVGALKENPNLTLIVEGHCDELGTHEYNLALGDRRARAAHDYLIRAGIPASRIKFLTYGEERPAVVGVGEDAWSRNRRGEFVTGS